MSYGTVVVTITSRQKVTVHVKLEVSLCIEGVLISGVYKFVYANTLEWKVS